MQTWFITGVSRGLGRALAEAALARGDMVIGTVRNASDQIDQGGGARLHLLTLDVADASAIEATIAQAFGVTGRIDVLVNNAGYGLLGALEEVRETELAHLFAVNVFGPVRLIQHALPFLRAQGSGHIINITSIAGRAPVGSSALYAATKAAVEALSQSLSQELAQFGLKVTAIAPGAFRTDFLSEHSFRQTSPIEAYAYSVGKAQAFLRSTAGRQPGDPARAALAILRLVDAPEPPNLLLLGSDALHRYREKLAAILEDIDVWQDLTTSTDMREGI